MTAIRPAARAISTSARIGFKASRPAVWRQKISWPVFLFLTTLLVPWAIYIGTLRLAMYRFVLLVMMLPCLVMWITGRAGRIRTADIALLMFSFWCMFSLIVIHGTELPIQTAGIVFLETVAPYMLARCYIRDEDDFYNLVQLMFGIVLLLFPFAFVEFVTGKDIWRDLFAAIWPVQVDKQMPSRGGLTRVQMGFDHPILFGICIASILAPVYLVLGYRRGLAQRSFKTAIVGAVSFMSLSAGPFVSLVLQVFLLSCNFLVRAIKIPWTILIGLMVLISLALQLVAKRSLLDIAAGFLVFESGSYWYRRMIWDYGVTSVLQHPLNGIGLNNWERGSDMSASIDNFWLMLAMRYGLPASFLLLLTMLSIFLALSFKKHLDDKITAYRTAFLISMTAFFLAGWTVHFWDTGYVLFLFMLGSGGWILDVRPKGKLPRRRTVFEPRLNE
jgi:hypothetical protein